MSDQEIPFNSDRRPNYESMWRATARREMALKAECARLREELEEWKASNKALADSVAYEQSRSAGLREERDELGLINTGILTVLAASDLGPTIPQERYPMVAQIKALRVSLAEALEALRDINNCIGYSDTMGQWVLPGRERVLPVLTRLRAPLAQHPESDQLPNQSEASSRLVGAAQHPEGTKGAGNV